MAVPVARHSLATTKVTRGFYAGRVGLHSRPSPLPRISPGDAKKSSAASMRGEAANTYGRRRRPAFCPATTKSPHGFCAGRSGLHSRPSPLPGIPPGDAKKSRAASARGMAVAIAQHPFGNDEFPARHLRGARRPILSAVAVAWHLALRS